MVSAPLAAALAAAFMVCVFAVLAWLLLLVDDLRLLELRVHTLESGAGSAESDLRAFLDSASPGGAVDSAPMAYRPGLSD